MVFEQLIIGSSPFLVGLAVFIGLALLLSTLRVSVEISALIIFPVTFIVVGDMIGGISPIITIIAGIIIGLFFMAVVRR